MDQLSEGIRRLILAGIGAVAATKEKSEVILDELVKKGELTVEQGKVLNEELKHNIKEVIRDNVTLHVVPDDEEKPETPEEEGETPAHDDLMDAVDGMNDEQLAAAGIPAGLIRISCGLEDKNDLIADIAQALEAI